MAYEGFGAGIQSALGSFRAASDDRFRKNVAREDLLMRREAADREQKKFTQELLEKDRANQTNDYRISISNFTLATGQTITDVNKRDLVTDLFSNPNAKRAGIEVLNLATRDVNLYTNEAGETVQGKLVDLEEKEFTDPETGKTSVRYIPIIERTDGTRAPMTHFRTPDGTDQITSLSAEQLNTKLRGAFQDGISKNGLLDNQGQILTGYSNLADGIEARQDAVLRREIVSQYKNDSGNNGTLTPANLTNFYDVVGDMPSEELRGLAVQMGVDVNALLETVEGDAREKWEAEVGPEKAKLGNLEQLLSELDPPMTLEAWDKKTPEQRAEIAKRIRTRLTGPGRKFWDAVPASLAAKGVDIWNDGASAVTYGFDLAVSNIGILNKFLGSIDDPVPAREETGKAGKAFEADLEERYGPSDAKKRYTEEDIRNAITNYDSIGTGEFAASNIELTQGDWLAAIKESAKKPNAQQMEVINGFLQKNNITNDTELAQAVVDKKISESDAIQTALAIAMTQTGGTDKQAALFGKTLNLIKHGDQEIDGYKAAAIISQQRKDAVDKTIAETQLQRARNAAKGERTEADKLKDKQWGDAQKIQKEVIDPFVDQVYDIVGIGNINEDTGRLKKFTARTPKGSEKVTKRLGRTITDYIRKINAAKSQQELRLHMDALNLAANFYAQGMAISDRGRFGQGFIDLFTTEPQGVIDYDLNKIRVARTEKGVITDIAYVTGDGQLSQSFKLKMIERESGGILAQLLRTAAKNNMKFADAE